MGSKTVAGLGDEEPPREDREEVLRLIKAAFLQRDMVAAEGADDEARAFVQRDNEQKSRSREAEAKRIAGGCYFVAEAAGAIAQQRGLGEEGARKFSDAMVRAGEARELTLRDPLTMLPIPVGQRVSLARIVTREDVNAWLDAQRAGYRWEGAKRSELAPRPVQRQAAQDAAILAKLADLGINAQAVPPAASGRASPAKQAVRAALGYSRDVMNKAWQRLRTAGAIKDA